jgi:hypothetical protein
MTIKSGVLTIKTNIGFTYTIDYKQDTSSWAVLEQGIRFESLQEALDWIESHEKALVANHEAMSIDCSQCEAKEGDEDSFSNLGV